MKNIFDIEIGGGSGIRTHESREALLVFETSAFVRSAIPPDGYV